jgi:hypothetical protein
MFLSKINTLPFPRFWYALLLPALLFMLSCDRAVTGSGERTTEERSIKDFSEVEIRGAAEVKIISGTDYGVSVTSYENIVSLIETSVNKDKLVISTTENINLSNSEINITVTTPTLESVTLSGAGNVVIKSFRQSKIKLNLQGAGNVQFSESEYDTVYASLSGAGNMSLNVKNYLDATLKGVGQIEYVGDPVVKSKISGIGSVSKK